MKKPAILLVMIALVLLIMTTPAAAVSVQIPLADGETKTISRSTANPAEILGFNFWDHAQGGFKIVATLNYDTSRGADQRYKYVYDVSAENGALVHTLSHILLEATNPSIAADFKAVSPAFSTDSPRVWTPGQGGGITNYGMPADLYGLKWNADGAGTYHVEFYSWKEPVWGDFYARCGGGIFKWNYAYNAGFGTDPTLATTDFGGWLPTPDGSPVPLPSTLFLFGSAFTGLAVLRGWLKKS